MYQAYLKHFIRILRGSHHLLCRRHVNGHRFLAQYVFAGLKRINGNHVVYGIRYADDHGIDIGLLQQGFMICVNFGYVIFFGTYFRTLLDDVADCDDLDSGAFLRCFKVGVRDASGTDHADFQQCLRQNKGLP
jgi:hypothetical protein